MKKLYVGHCDQCGNGNRRIVSSETSYFKVANGDGFYGYDGYTFDTCLKCWLKGTLYITPKWRVKKLARLVWVMSLFPIRKIGLRKAYKLAKQCA